MVKCASCGKDNQPGSIFCDFCGSNMATANVPSYPPQPSYPPVQQQQPPMAGGGGVCSQCGQSYIPGSGFCDSCGSPLGAPVVIPPGNSDFATVLIQPQGAIYPPPVQPAASVTARLVSDTGEISVFLTPGKILVLGRRDAASNHTADIDLEDFGGHSKGVGRIHAHLVLENGQVFVIDQNAVNFTYVNGVKLTPNVRQPLNNGDQLKAGILLLTYYVN